MKIEKILALKQVPALRQKGSSVGQQPGEGSRSGTTSRRLTVNPVPRSAGTKTQFIAALISKLLEPVPQMGGGVPYELTEEYKKKKKKKRPSL
jgi:hypothetical protein